MSAYLAYGLGLCTPFALAFAYILFARATDRNHSMGCRAEDWGHEIGERTRLGAWLSWRWHLATVGRKRWHREAVAAEVAKWGR